ncbi:transmembrane channel-like protein 5 isoform X2 [Octodon degus]|uniref:Transmembrane channel-like protein n=1 Tax=Octodon degus TaxID=10160 RepID=A0A6P6DKG2_OCTDE|nr:transmembrane channel-like protein 5 isoform X2 [Octodon degus]
MAAYYRNNSYSNDEDYPDYSRPQDHNKEYLKIQNYLDIPGSQNNPDYPSSRSNAHSVGSRTNPGFSGSLTEPDYPGSTGTPDYPHIRNNPYSEDSRTSPDYHRSLSEPDYNEFQNNPRHLGSPRKPESPRSQRNPDFADSRISENYANTRRKLDHFGTLEEADYPGAKGNTNHPGQRANFNHPGSRRGLGYAGSRVSPYTDFLGQPDYPGAENQPNPCHSFGEPDYPGSVDHQNSPNFWGEPDYPDSKDGQGYSPSEIRNTTRWGNGPSGILGGENEEYPESIEMTSVKMANPYGHALPGAPGNGYVNPAFMGENGSLGANGNLLSSECDWHGSPQGQKLIESLIPMTSRDRVKTIRNQPRTMEEKRKLRNIIDKEKSKQSHHTLRLNCCAHCLSSISLGCRRSKNSLSELLSSISLWQKTLKVIGGKFGTSVLCYFNFLRWLLKFNIFSFILNLSFITVPQLTVAERNTLPFTGLEFLTGAENLSEILQENVKFTFRQQLARFSAHVAAWLVSTGVAVACCVAVYYLAEHNSKFLHTHKDPGAVLLLPFVVSCINLAVPRFYSMFGLVERYEMPRHEVYTLLIRNIFLKISIIGILCYYWLNIVALSDEECWETFIGQEIYRLLLMDFVFSLADSFLGEFLRRIIGTRFIKSLGLQEFDIARNVLELIYAQTLVWIGIFFCPLLPLIQMIALFIMFYVKNISLMMNFQPPSKAWRASQMMTLFIFLLFFPSFTGVLCTLAITIWRLKPSGTCGPFRGLPSFIQSIYLWIDTLRERSGYMWVVWIYQNLIGSVHFFFILTLIVLIITYLYWQITEGRKVMIRLLHEQIINEGKDKMFLIEKLTKLQEMEKRANPSALILERRETEQHGPLHLMEGSATSDLRLRRSVQEDYLKA